MSQSNQVKELEAKCKMFEDMYIELAKRYDSLCLENAKMFQMMNDLKELLRK